jgi:hypothetical protein
MSEKGTPKSILENGFQLCTFSTWCRRVLSQCACVKRPGRNGIGGIVIVMVESSASEMEGEGWVEPVIR